MPDLDLRDCCAMLAAAGVTRSLPHPEPPPPPSVPQTARRRVYEVLERHAPEHLAVAEQLLRDNAGHEHDLVAELERKYAHEAAASVPRWPLTITAAAAAAALTTVVSAHVGRLASAAHRLLVLQYGSIASAWAALGGPSGPRPAELLLGLRRAGMGAEDARKLSSQWGVYRQKVSGSAGDLRAFLRDPPSDDEEAPAPRPRRRAPASSPRVSPRMSPRASPRHQPRAAESQSGSEAEPFRLCIKDVDGDECVLELAGPHVIRATVHGQQPRRAVRALRSQLVKSTGRRVLTLAFNDGGVACVDPSEDAEVWERLASLCDAAQLSNDFRADAAADGCPSPRRRGPPGHVAWDAPGMRVTVSAGGQRGEARVCLGKEPMKTVRTVRLLGEGADAALQLPELKRVAPLPDSPRARAVALKSARGLLELAGVDHDVPAPRVSPPCSPRTSRPPPAPSPRAGRAQRSTAAAVVLPVLAAACAARCSVLKPVSLPKTLRSPPPGQPRIDFTRGWLRRFLRGEVQLQGLGKLDTLLTRLQRESSARDPPPTARTLLGGHPRAMNALFPAGPPGPSGSVVSQAELAEVTACRVCAQAVARAAELAIACVGFKYDSEAGTASTRLAVVGGPERLRSLGEGTADGRRLRRAVARALHSLAAFADPGEGPKERRLGGLLHLLVSLCVEHPRPLAKCKSEVSADWLPALPDCPLRRRLYAALHGTAALPPRPRYRPLSPPTSDSDSSGMTEPTEAGRRSDSPFLAASSSASTQQSSWEPAEPAPQTLPARPRMLEAEERERIALRGATLQWVGAFGQPGEPEAADAPQPAPAVLPCLGNSALHLRVEESRTQYRVIVRGAAGSVRVAVAPCALTLWLLGDADPAAECEVVLFDELSLADQADDSPKLISALRRVLRLYHPCLPELAHKAPLGAGHTEILLVKSPSTATQRGCSLSPPAHRVDPTVPASPRAMLTPSRPLPACRLSEDDAEWVLCIRGRPESLQVEASACSVTVSCMAEAPPALLSPTARVVADEIAAPFGGAASPRAAALTDGARRLMQSWSFARRNGVRVQNRPLLLSPLCRTIPLPTPCAAEGLRVSAHGTGHTIVRVPKLAEEAPLCL
eukprot:TRINITY_DN17530_c0_g1_i2.p1 TRINITY_DN17530_c0_g1~~TRINITY_DN17530_c0_g1_i2.p1  ORF type:complete len:1110 (+),score=227.79 TRINITY_DN17530_c0_g1_i2:1698-5027(+)